jgi:hypothetical protein
LQWQQTKQIKPHIKINQGTNSNLITGGLNITEFQEVGLFKILMDLKDHTGENLMDLKDQTEENLMDLKDHTEENLMDLKGHTGENIIIQGTTINNLKI